MNERLQGAVGEADGLRHSLEEEKLGAAQAAAKPGHERRTLDRLRDLVTVLRLGLRAAASFLLLPPPSPSACFPNK